MARLVATAPGWARTEVAVEWDAVDRILVVLRPDERLAGYVCDERFDAIAGAHVVVAAGGLTFETRTDERGRFVLTSLPNDRCGVLVRARGYLPKKANVVREDDDREVRVFLAEGADLAVRVVDDMGVAVAGATVTAHSNRNAPPITAVTDPDGYVPDFGIHAKGGTLRAIASGKARTTLHLSPPLPREVELVLRPEARVVVRSNARGGPRSDAWVVSLYDLEDRSAQPQDRRLSPEGVAEFGGSRRAARTAFSRVSGRR